MQTDAPKVPSPRQYRTQRTIARERFTKARRVEGSYARQLARVAKHVGDIVNGMAPKGIVTNVTELNNVLAKYAELLAPWARSVAARMISEVGQKDEQAWNAAAKELGRSLRNEIRSAPTGETTRNLLALEVDLITSLPREAAKRVHKLTLEALSTSERASEIATEIMKSGSVTRSRAMLIARTEVARTASTLTQARALHVGSEGYIWHSVGDSDVRPLHRKLNGKFIRWDAPPVAGENGELAHAGCIYNCRCWPEPVIPDE